MDQAEPLPPALRARFQRNIEEGFSGRAAALRVKLSPATGARWARQIKTKGHTVPAPQGRPRNTGKLAPYSLHFNRTGMMRALCSDVADG